MTEKNYISGIPVGPDYINRNCGIMNIEYNGKIITFWDTSQSEDVLMDYLAFIQQESWVDWKPVIPFDSQRNLHDVGCSSWLVEYTDVNQRNRDADLLRQLQDVQTDTIKSPEVTAIFDFNGKYYLSIFAWGGAKGETNLDQGLYQGMIIDPEKYLKSTAILPLQTNTRKEVANNLQ